MTFHSIALHVWPRFNAGHEGHGLRCPWSWLYQVPFKKKFLIALKIFQWKRPLQNEIGPAHSCMFKDEITRLLYLSKISTNGNSLKNLFYFAADTVEVFPLVDKVFAIESDIFAEVTLLRSGPINQMTTTICK